MLWPFSYTMHSPCSHQLTGDVTRHSVVVPQWHTYRIWSASTFSSTAKTTNQLIGQILTETLMIQNQDSGRTAVITVEWVDHIRIVDWQFQQVEDNTAVPSSRVSSTIVVFYNSICKVDATHEAIVVPNARWGGNIDPISLSQRFPFRLTVLSAAGTDASYSGAWIVVSKWTGLLSIYTCATINDFILHMLSPRFLPRNDFTVISQGNPLRSGRDVPQQYTYNNNQLRYLKAFMLFKAI